MNINLMAPINQLGYGVAGLNIYKALTKLANVSLFVMGQPQVTNEADANIVRQGIENARFFDPIAPCIKIWHQNQMAERIGSGKFIGFPIFELDTFTDLEKHHLMACDELLVCSQWAKDVVLTEVYPTPVGHDLFEDRVHVVPLGVDAEIFKPAPVKQDDKIIFFNCGKWEVRKGHDILIKAFKKIADKYENVELWMMCENPFNSPEEENRWLQLYNHPKIKLINRVETQEEVYNIMCKIDCGVFPSRGEGWNLELLELMSAGKHVIATDYSAHTQFCNETNCGLIKISDKEPAFDGKWFFGQGRWAKIDDTAMESLYNNMEKFIQEKLGTINESGIETAKDFSWKNTASEILNVIR